MNRIPSELPHNGSGQTLTVPANRGLDGRGRSTSEPRRCMALVPGSGTPLTYEVHCLLRRRLRVAGLIAWSAASIFLVRNWLIEGSADGPTGFEMAMHALVVAILSLVTGLLWSRIDLTPRALRGAELALFGALAVYFAILQFNVFHHGELFRGVGPEATDRILTIAAHANSLRWFVIITLYGTFIPNTWKRCTAVVAVLVAMPVLLNFFICFRCPVMGEHTWTATFDPLVILGTGAAIAIFGSYKLSSLQAEAFAAKKLGQYQLRQLLGSGGMGEVYLGEHTLLRRACAIKIIRADQAGDPTTLSRFEREVRAMATLTHWNTVEIYDYGRADDGTFYYVMEYLPGMSLQEMVERHGPLPPGRAVHFLRQVCAALKEAHGIGLIHRDIKPSNVLVCERGGVRDVAKLLDFGLVHHSGLHEVSSKLTVQGAILGSPPYISPEQAMGKPDVDGRTDIYSLGGLAYFLLTGQAPFVRETAMEHLVAHLHEPVTPPRQLRAEIPEDLEEIIIRCLQKRREDRFPDIASLDRALATCEAAQEWDADQAAQWWRGQEETPSLRAELVS